MQVIRNVVVGRLREPGDAAQAAADSARLDEGLAAIAAIRLPGLLAMHTGRDLELREGGWSFAISNDWADADAYRRYDLDEEHNRIRRELFAPVCAQIARVQFALDT